MKYYPILLATLLGLSLAGCGMTEKAPETAKPQAEAAVDMKPQAPVIAERSEALYHQAAQAYGKDNQAEALQLANQALEADRNNYKAYSLQGIILAFSGSPEEGIAAVQKSLEIAPAYTQAFFDMAMAQKLGKHYDESIFYFQKVLAVDAKNTWSYYGIATNYADKRDKAHALEYLQKAMALDPDHVRPEAVSQDHFTWLREDPEFQRITK